MFFSKSLALEHLIVATILLLNFTTVLASGSTCYWQNSTQSPDSPDSIAPNDVPCFPNLDQSPCCASGWTCLSDGVCSITQSNHTFYYRGTCTDASWGSDQCPGWCFAQNSNSSIPLAKCSTSGPDTYCCPGDPDCNCESGLNVINLGDSQPSTITVISATSWPGFTGSVTLNPTSFVNDGTSTSIESSTKVTSTTSGRTTTTTRFTNSTRTTSTASASTETTIATMTMSGSTTEGPSTSVVIVTASSSTPSEVTVTATSSGVSSSATLGSNMAYPGRDISIPLLIGAALLPVVILQR